MSFWSVVGYAAAGVLVGVVTAAVIVAAAPAIGLIATGALIAAGVSSTTAAAVVTAGAGLAAIGGAAYAGYTTGGAIEQGIETGNWNQAAFDIGSLVGAGSVTADVWIETGGDLSVGLYDSDYQGLVSSGQISQLQNDINWLGTLPTDESAALVASAIAWGLDAALGNLIDCGNGQQ